MPYAQHTWVSGEKISSDKLNNIEAGIAAAGEVVTGPLTGDVMTTVLFRLRTSPAAFTYGGVSSSGVLHLTPDASTWIIPSGFSGDTTDTAAAAPGASVTAVVFNKLYILPAHGACTVNVFSFQLAIAFSSGTVVYYRGYDVSLVKISAAGVETTLSTKSSGVASYASVNDAGAAYAFYTHTGNNILTTPAAIADGERLAFRIKLYGMNNGGTITMALNIDGGSVASPQVNETKPTFLSLGFS